MGSALALTFTPFFEGFGIPITEAFRAGIPVITSNLTAMPEVAGQAAVLVNPFDPKEIAQAMKKITFVPDLRRELVEKGFHLGRLTAILDELRNRLAFTKDTPIAYDLEELYNYVDQCVQEAVYEKDTYYLDAGIDILTEMRDTWMHMLASLGELDLKMED